MRRGYSLADADPRNRAFFGSQFNNEKARSKRAFFELVLWARLELARLAPLPPQDSVSTNSTTRAVVLFYTLIRGRLGRRWLVVQSR